jgi:hypothetical protein
MKQQHIYLLLITLAAALCLTLLYDSRSKVDASALRPELQITAESHETERGQRTAVEPERPANAMPLPRPVVDSNSPTPDPLARHSWARIGGLCWGEPHPSARDCIGDAYFNPKTLVLSDDQVIALQEVIDALNAKVAEARQTAALALDDAVTSKRQSGAPPATQEELDSARLDDGGWTLSSSGSGFAPRKDRIVPGEYAWADAAAADARAVILKGEPVIRDFIAAHGH